MTCHSSTIIFRIFQNLEAFKLCRRLHKLVLHGHSLPSRPDREGVEREWSHAVRQAKAQRVRNRGTSPAEEKLREELEAKSDKSFANLLKFFGSFLRAP